MDIMKKLAELADKCDEKGLYEEASILDGLLGNTNSEEECVDCE